MKRVFFIFISLSLCTVFLHGSWELKKITEIKAPSQYKYRDVAWNKDGTRLFVSWGTDGTQLGIIDMKTGAVSTIEGGTFGISQIEYKDDSPIGLMTICGKGIYSQSGASEIRSWNVAQKTSQSVVAGQEFGFQSLASGPSNMWACVAGMVRGGSLTALYILDGDSLASIIHSPESYKSAMSTAFCPDSTQCVMSFLLPREQQVGALYDPMAKGFYKTVKADYPGKDGYPALSLSALKYNNGRLLGWGSHIRNRDSVCPAIVEWDSLETPGKVYDYLQFPGGMWTPSFDVNDAFVVGSTRWDKQEGIYSVTYNSVFVMLRNALDTVVCSENFKSSATGVALNPAVPNQVAISDADGVYIYSIIEDEPEERHPQDLEEIYRRMHGWPKA